MENFKAKYIVQGLVFACLFLFGFTYIGMAISWNNSFLKFTYGTIVGIVFFCIILHTLWEVDERTQDEYKDLLDKRFLPVRFPGIVTLLLFVGVLGHQALKMRTIYNQHKVYVNTYKQATQSLNGFYDMTWKTFAQKHKIADSAKAFGLEITRIMYENKKDQPALGFKLLLEAKIVPVEAITAFYSDLSAYIETKRSEYYSLEVRRQQIALQQNILLDTFPNNVYNKVLNLEPIEYRYAFLSDSTNNVFTTGKENLK